MSSIRVMTQSTPNPHALKFASSVDMIIGKKETYRTSEECGFSLGEELFGITGVEQLHFYENTVTVTKDHDIPWEAIEPKIIDLLNMSLVDHDPQLPEKIKPVRESKMSTLSAEYLALNGLFDEMIRPGLQQDGGDVDIISIEGNVITVDYRGACHGCPHASIGTLQYIQSVVSDFNSEYKVVLASGENGDDNWW